MSDTINDRKVFHIHKNLSDKENMIGFMDRISKDGSLNISGVFDGKHILRIGNLMSEHYILNRTEMEISGFSSRKGTKAFRFTEGINFTKARLISPEKFIKNQERELNPSWAKRNFKAMSENPLINSIISALLGGLIAWLLI